MEKLYTLHETAGLLKVSTRSVLRYIKSGRLKATKIGQWRVSESSLDEFLDVGSKSKKHEQNRKK